MTEIPKKRKPPARGQPGSWIARPMAARVGLSDELLDRMVRAIVNEVDPEQVILFGSRARGEQRETSDVDLIVIEAKPFGPERSKHQEMLRLHRAVSGFRVPTDVLVFSNDEVDYWRDSLNHVLARALREGKVLYERP